VSLSPQKVKRKRPKLMAKWHITNKLNEAAISARGYANCKKPFVLGWQVRINKWKNTKREVIKKTDK